MLLKAQPKLMKNNNLKENTFSKERKEEEKEIASLRPTMTKLLRDSI